MSVAGGVALRLTGLIARPPLSMNEKNEKIVCNWTHISCVAERAVSFGASASFGDARLSVRPPGLLFLDAADRIRNM